jgi:hypothetical protein
MNFNSLVLGSFSSLILFIGAMAFFMPEPLAFVSTAYSCNLLRVNLGVIGIIFALLNHQRFSPIANLVLGMILAYQAFAAFFHLYPEEYFQWAALDNILNMDIGLIMILLFFLRKSESR